MIFEQGNPNNVLLLIVVAICAMITGYALVVRGADVNKFVSPALRGRLISGSGRGRNWISALLVLASLALLAIALLDIRWGKTWHEVPQKGIEVMFALDVSRSMLAEDALPNRLARAKQQIGDMIDEMAGDRIGLVVFAGGTRQSVPLTSHYDDFKNVLETVGPHTITRGGSRLGDAIQAAADGFISKTNDHKAIIVFTDGEDQESQPVELAKKLHEEEGIRIFTVGLGDVTEGSRIPNDDVGGGFVKYQGRQVWSKMNGEILKQIAQETDGAYIPAGTKRVNMADVYHGYVANVDETEFETAKINAFIPRFQWFALPALILLLIETWLSTRASKKRALKSKSKQSGRDRLGGAGRQSDVSELDYEVSTDTETQAA